MASLTAKVSNGISSGKRSYAQIPTVLDIPNLIQVQLDSFNWFKDFGLNELFEEISPIEDFAGGRFELSFEDHYFEDPKYSEDECREKEVTFSAPLHVTVKLKIKASGPGQGEVKEQSRQAIASDGPRCLEYHATQESLTKLAVSPSLCCRWGYKIDNE